MKYRGRWVVRWCGLLLLALALGLPWLLGSHLVAEALPTDHRQSGAFGLFGETPNITVENPRRGEASHRVVQFGLRLAF
jgi:hypothetical protein